MKLAIVVDVESDPPTLLGTLMPARPDDEGLVVRYFDSGRNEEYWGVESGTAIRVGVVAASWAGVFEWAD